MGEPDRIVFLLDPYDRYFSTAVICNELTTTAVSTKFDAVAEYLFQVVAVMRGRPSQTIVDIRLIRFIVIVMRLEFAGPQSMTSRAQITMALSEVIADSFASTQTFPSTGQL